MYYLIQKSLAECEVSELRGTECPFVAVLTPAEWEREKELFDMGIDLDLNPADIHNTKIEVNYDSLTGTFSKIKNSRQWKMPCLERFLYDFLEQIVHEDLDLMERYDSRLDQIEKDILDTGESGHVKEINLIRSDIRELRIHYEQLMDFVQELEENENGFFREEHLRYFHMLSNRMDRLYDSATHLRDYTMQLSDLYQSQIDLKQNRIMTILTVVTTIFMPLTLITGWYGMNFTYMPELDSPYGYPIIIVVALMIAVASLLYFKRKKWL